MTCIDATLPYRSMPSAAAPHTANVSEPTGNGAHRRTDWRLGDNACATLHDLRLATAIREACDDKTQGLVTSLTMPGIGRFERGVRHGISHIAVRIHCDTRLGYLWLAPKRSLLERGLARSFGCPASVELSAGTSP